MFFNLDGTNLLIAVKIIPNAPALAVKGVFTNADGHDFLKISVVSVPEKGKANKELIKFLSSELKVARSNMEIISGQTSHFKKIAVKTQSETAITKLNEWSML